MTAEPPRNEPPTGDRPDDDVDTADEEALSWDTSIRDASYVEGPKPVREKPGKRASTSSATEATEASEATEADPLAEPVEAEPVEAEPVGSPGTELEFAL